MVHLILFSVVALAIALRKTEKQVQAIPFVLLFVFSALRYNFGNDYPEYHEHHDLIQAEMFSYSDIGFNLFNIVISNFYLLVVIETAFYIGLTYWIIKNNVDRRFIWISTAIFVLNPYIYLMNLSTMRQCIAMVLFGVAVCFATRKRWIPVILLMLAATQFHKSAYLMLATIPLMNDRPIKRRTAIIIGLFVVALVATGAFDILVNSILDLYADANYYYYYQEGGGNSIRSAITAGIMLLFLVLNYPYIKDEAVVFCKLYSVGLIITILAVFVAAFSRFQMYFDYLSIVAIPCIISACAQKGVYSKEGIRKLTVGGAVRVYILPALIAVIIIGKYYNFFHDPLWSSFSDYQTIFSVLLN